MAVYNHLLFSEIFFQQVRSETTDLDNLRATLSTIRDTWQYYLPPPPQWDGPAWVPVNLFPPDDVAQLRAKAVERIFAYLELTYGPCEADECACLLYADWSREDQTGLCLVLPYSANIEGRDPETGIIPKGRNYAQQLIRLLREHELDWGVLTNGRHWRLFHRTELSPTETYLHMDLERIIAADDIENYIVFHRFFSRSAFARHDSRQRLDLYKQQADEATKVIEDHLSTQVEEIVRQLCQGLVQSCREAGEDLTTSETRAAIYKNALFLVYRLLFVFYAEARDLLPLDAPTYRAVCLQNLLAEVRDNHKHGMRYDDDYAMWDRLQALFALIDQGDPAAGVSAYNGGLFDPGRRLFLTEHRIRNDYLQAALISLSTLPAKGKTYDQDREPQPIDYRDLSVRHLGSLYEGLLEYNLFVVEDEPHVVRVNKKKTKYVPYSQAGKVRASETLLQVGDVYFSETAGERKATGSYYTPEDVVDYIVHNTVGTKLADLKEDFYETQQINRQLADLADTPADIPGHRQIQQSLDDQFLRFVREEVLDLKILDPAMGSGHFLVNATHAVANFIVELLNETPWENPEMDTDVATWKREVAERCIFGVDLNELAVELAKLCLWMTTTAKGKPLTFLDHHLRWGNSLVGAWLKDVGVYPLARRESEQAFTLPLERFQLQLDEVLAGYQELYSKSSDDVEGVRDKARMFDEDIYPALKPYRELLNLHTSVYFGSNLDETTYAQLGTALEDPAAWTRLKTLGLGDLLAQYVDPRWLHWELEFPEVFVSERQPRDPDSSDRVGFDVVLGNPPYADQPSEADQLFPTLYVSSNSGDLYTLFVELMTKTSARDAHGGMILPLSITFSRRMTSLRTRLEKGSRHWFVSSFDRIPDALFGSNVRTRNSIALMKPSDDGLFHLSTGPLLRWFSSERHALFTSLRYHSADEVPHGNIGWPKLGSGTQAKILGHLLSQRYRLGDICVSRHSAAPVVYYSQTAYNWLTATRRLPPVYDRAGNLVSQTKYGNLALESEEDAWFVLSILTSLFAFWFWLVYGDGFDVTQGLLKAIPISPARIGVRPYGRLVELGRNIQDEMEKHVVFKWNAGKRIGNYNLRRCRHLTHHVDVIIFEETGLGRQLLADMLEFCGATIKTRLER